MIVGVGIVEAKTRQLTLSEGSRADSWTERLKQTVKLMVR